MRVELSATHVFAAIFSLGIVAPVTWMTWDRSPPYVRESGEVVEADPAECGLLADAPRGVVPGGCVNVRWHVRPIRNCPPATNYNVTRSVRDAQGLHPLPSIGSKYSSDRYYGNPIVRSFTLPVTSPVGLATYHSEAHFACNPLQRLFWPVVVNSPDIQFMIGEPLIRGPR